MLSNIRKASRIGALLKCNLKGLQVMPRLLSGVVSSYKSVDDDDITAFKSFTKSVLTDVEDLKPYNTDWMNKYSGSAKVVLRPKSTNEVSEILRYCNDKKICVVPQVLASFTIIYIYTLYI